MEIIFKFFLGAIYGPPLAVIGGQKIKNFLGPFWAQKICCGIFCSFCMVAMVLIIIATYYDDNFEAASRCFEVIEKFLSEFFA